MAFLAIASGASAVVCAGLIWLLWPVLRRYALARPNARSSHTVPTPQGGGIAVIAATLARAAAGAVDDILPLSPLLRLVLQSLVVGVVVLAASGTGRLLPGIVPLWLERGLAVVAGVWFVNLVNFMDGIDWITVAEMAPITAALMLFGALGLAGQDVTVVAAALFGAIVGVAPFNRPV